MPGPKSFSGEDMVEIYCHAGRFSVQAILEAVLACGCRPAEAGEFSMRRFRNHGVDLTRLEAAAELIAAKTDLAYRLSREHLLGAYGDHIAGIRQRIVHLLAELEADIDFPEEDAVGRIGRAMLHDRLDGIINDLESLAASYRAGQIVRDGYRVVLTGPPNAGKSLLFNRLVRRRRALVTPVPGTTRDYITEWIDIEGLPVELYDTAGLRRGRSPVEKAGIEGTQEVIAGADLVVYVADLSAETAPTMKLDLRHGQQLIFVLNKVDLLHDDDPTLSRRAGELNEKQDHCFVSALTGRGIAGLLRLIHQKSGLADLAESMVVTSHRHKVKIDRCLGHLRRIRRMSDQPTEIISFELRQSADQIGEITGAIYTEQILDEIFSNFCIGK